MRQGRLFQCCPPLLLLLAAATLNAVDAEEKVANGKNIDEAEHAPHREDGKTNESPSVTGSNRKFNGNQEEVHEASQAALAEMVEKVASDYEQRQEANGISKKLNQPTARPQTTPTNEPAQLPSSPAPKGTSSPPPSTLKKEGDIAHSSSGPAKDQEVDFDKADMNGNGSPLDDHLKKGYVGEGSQTGPGYFSYLVVASIVCFAVYLVFHNKQKILALILEGRRKKGGSRRSRSSSAQYRKLDNNLEEAMGGNGSDSLRQIIY